MPRGKYKRKRESPNVVNHEGKPVMSPLFTKREREIMVAKDVAFKEGYEAAKREQAKQLSPKEDAYVSMCQSMAQAINSMAMALDNFRGL